MAKNDLKLFAGGSSANVMSQAEYEAFSAIVNGFSTGVAQSRQLNKVWRQASFVAAMIGLFTCNNSSEDVLDDGDVDGFEAKFGRAMQTFIAAQTSLGSFWQPVTSVSVVNPPANTVLGDAYVIPNGATGAWAGKDQSIAVWSGSAWRIFDAKDGHGVGLPDGRLFVKTDGAYVEKVEGGAFGTLVSYLGAGSFTFTVPERITKIRVRVWGGGGGGGGGSNTPGSGHAGRGGAGGGYAEGIYSVTPGQVLPVIVGKGGDGGATLGSGRNVETSSVSNFISATGGGGGFYLPAGDTSQHQLPGVGIGEIQMYGGEGGLVVPYDSAGNCLGGWGGIGGLAAGPGGTQSSTIGSPGSIPGGGGGGAGGPAGSVGGRGGGGCVYIEY